MDRKPVGGATGGTNETDQPAACSSNQPDLENLQNISLLWEELKEDFACDMEVEEIMSSNFRDGDTCIDLTLSAKIDHSRCGSSLNFKSRTSNETSSDDSCSSSSYSDRSSMQASPSTSNQTTATSQIASDNANSNQHEELPVDNLGVLIRMFQGKPKQSPGKSQESHMVNLSNSDGAILNVYYFDYHLIVVQDAVIGFWKQTGLGNVLGANNMWIPEGTIRRMVFKSGFVLNKSAGRVFSSKRSVGYVDLWMNEVELKKPKRPVLNVYAAIFFKRSQEKLARKILRLENVHGYASQVQYLVLRSSPSIIVCWNVTDHHTCTSLTTIRRYRFSEDFQTITQTIEMQDGGHSVDSLQNIQDNDSVILGCGDHQITIWNLKNNLMLTTINLGKIQTQSRILCSTYHWGFFSVVDHESNGDLSLIIINAFNGEWKKIQTFQHQLEHKNLLGAYLENKLLLVFYDTGVVCWSTSGKLIKVVLGSKDCVFFLFERHVVIFNNSNNNIYVQAPLQYIITSEMKKSF